MIKSFDETFRGWGGIDRHGREYGFEGFSIEAAQKKAADISAEMNNVRGILQINVSLEKMPNGNYAVHNRSTYET